MRKQFSKGRASNLLDNIQMTKTNDLNKTLIDETLKFIAQLDWKKNHLSFFDAIVKYLGEVFKVKYVFVDHIDTVSSNIAKTISLYSNGEIIKNIEYDLNFTPCEQVHGKSLCCYVENVQVLFPKDQLLKDLEVESYIGIPLWSSSGQAIGLIGIMDTKPFIETKEMEQVLQILAVRSAHELEQDISRKVLIEQSNFNKEIISAVNEGVVVYDLDLKYIVWNSFMESLTGLESSKVIGKKPTDIFPFLEASGIIQNIKNVLNNLESTTIEVEYFHHEKQVSVWLRDFNKPVYDSSGELKGVIGTITDITHYKEQADILLKARKEAERALTVKTEFLANMSHEIRTPINGIYGILQLLEMELLSPFQLDYILKAKKSSESLLRIINDILDYSKLEAEGYEFVYQNFRLNDLITSIRTHFRQDITEKENLLIFSVMSDLSALYYGDQVRLTQILSNLVSNANKFTHQGTIEIVIEAPVILESKRVELKFSVKDNGIGISEDHLSEIFKSFRQVDNSNTRTYSGAGLGLSIAKKIIDKNGGRIEVESELGTGSRFTFTYIVESEKSETLANDFYQVIQETKMNTKVLVVDDDDLSSLILVNMLMKLGYSALSVNNAIDAIRLIQEETFSIIIMDIQMPEMDGIEATRRIRDIRNRSISEMPIVAVTAHSLMGDRERILASGFTDYLSKPVNMNILTTTLEKYS